MPTLLITGANRGIGLEFVKQYAADGWRVHACCRDPAAAGDLAEVAGDVTVHALDVADHAAIEALAAKIGDEPIDILLNNAGVLGGSRPTDKILGKIDYDLWTEVFRINTLSSVKMAECFVDNIARSEQKRIVSITSKLGATGGNQRGSMYLYRTTKAALNNAAKSMSIDLRDRGIIVIVCHPGHVRTDMGGPHGDLAVEDSVAQMRMLVAGLRPVDSGYFFNYDATVLPW